MCINTLFYLKIVAFIKLGVKLLIICRKTALY